MATVALGTGQQREAADPRRYGAWDRLKVNRNWLGLWFMLPAAGFLILFLAYPLGLGVWMSFTDAKIGRAGDFIGIENYEWLARQFDLLAVGVQHLALHDGRQRLQIRDRPLSGAAAEPEHAVQGDDPRARC